MIKVKKGQDPYSVIGQYIIDHVLVIEDMIAVIEIDGKTSNELFMVDMTVDEHFIWKSDWYEGGENVVLIDFFPVSDACNPKDHWIPCSERLPDEKDAGILKKLGIEKRSEDVLATVEVKGERMTVTTCTYDGKWEWDMKYAFPDYKVIAWMPLPEPFRGEKENETY